MILEREDRKVFYSEMRGKMRTFVDSFGEGGAMVKRSVDEEEDSSYEEGYCGAGFNSIGCEKK